MNRLPHPTFDPRVADWLEKDPSLAPREVLSTVLAAFPSIEQRPASRRPWRLPTMNPAIRLAASAVAVFAIAGMILLTLNPTSNIGPPASPTAPVPSAIATSRGASAAPTGPLRAGPLSLGTYVGPVLKVADVIAALNANTSLTTADRNLVIDTLAEIRNKTTVMFSLEFRGGQMTQRQTVDEVTQIGSLGRYSFPDDHTLVYTENVEGSEAVMRFEVSVDGDTFTLRRTTPVDRPVDDFVTKLIFESGPFALQ